MGVQRTSFFSSCCVNIFPIGTRKPNPRFFTSIVCFAPPSVLKRACIRVKIVVLTHAVLEFSLLVAKVVHLLHQITPQNEPAGPTPRYREGRRVRLLWPRHEGWEQRRAGKDSGCCHRHEEKITVRGRGALRDNLRSPRAACVVGAL